MLWPLIYICVNFTGGSCITNAESNWMHKYENKNKVFMYNESMYLNLIMSFCKHDYCNNMMCEMKPEYLMWF